MTEPMKPDREVLIRDPRDKRRWVRATYRDSMYGWFLLRWRSVT